MCRITTSVMLIQLEPWSISEKLKCGRHSISFFSLCIFPQASYFFFRWWNPKHLKETLLQQWRCQDLMCWANISTTEATRCNCKAMHPILSLLIMCGVQSTKCIPKSSLAGSVQTTGGLLERSCIWLGYRTPDSPLAHAVIHRPYQIYYMLLRVAEHARVTEDMWQFPQSLIKSSCAPI